MFRVLRPGGRVAVSDIALKQTLPSDLARSVAAYVGCIAGAITVADYRRGLEDSGFVAVQVIDTGSDLNAYAKVENQAGCCSPGGCCEPVLGDLVELMRKYDVNQYAASVQVYALKPPLAA